MGDVRRPRSLAALGSSAVFAFFLLFGWPAGQAMAATITVNDQNDPAGAGATCTLRRAVRSVNQGSDFGGCVANVTQPYATNDTIIVPAGNYVLTNSGTDNAAAAGDLDVNRNVTITGAGARSTIVDGDGALSEDRVFDIGPMGAAIVSISGVTITNGVAGAATGSNGGGIRVTSGSQLTLTDTTVSDNLASIDGGGIFSDGDLTIVRSTITGNEADGSGGGTANGAGIAIGGGANSIVNSTFSNNDGVGFGGGLYVALGTTLVSHTTFSTNTAPGTGGAIVVDGGTVRIRANIFANSVLLNCVVNAGTLTSLGSSLSDDATCATGGTDLANVANLNLGPLANNGGQTDTHALLPQSRARDFVQGPCTVDGGAGAPVAVDQRNVGRPIDGNGDGTATCDSGAVEAPPPGQFRLSSTTYTANEGDGVAPIVVQRIGGSDGAVSVRLTPSDGTATAPADYDNLTLLVSFADGDAADKTANIPIVDDTLDEPNETVNLALNTPTGGAGIGTPSTAVLTIVDNDPTPTISISDAPAVTEGNTGSVLATFTVTLSAASSFTISAQVDTSDGTATANSDYTPIVAQGVTFNPGETSKTVTVSVLGDTLNEANETFNVNLSAPANATILDGLGVGTITDDDPATISIDDQTVTEGNSGTTNAVFHVTLSRASSQTITVVAQTADGTATAGQDYTATGPTTLTFTPGSTSQTFTVPVIGDTVDEPNETFLVNLSGLSSANGVSILDAQGVGTINDDDGAPALSIADVSQAEGSSGTTNFVFTVSLLPASGQTVTVVAQTADGTATAADNDYTPTGPTTLTFTPGTTTQQFTVPVRGDTKPEADETFLVNLTGAVNATIIDNQATGTIRNDDSASLSINDVSQAEGNSGTTNFVFTVTLSTASAQTVTVVAQTADGTATVANNDYVATGPTTLTFTSGATTQQFTVPVRGDTVNEPDERFFVNLSAATNATIGDSQGIGTIVNDDGQPALSINDVSLPEGNSGTTAFTFTVTLSPASGQTVTVQAQTADGTATAGSDYTAVGPVTLTFAAGVTTQTVTVPVIGDPNEEPDETFFVRLSGATNATIADGEGLGTILNDDRVGAPVPVPVQAETTPPPPPEEKEDSKPKPTEEQRQQHQLTNTSNKDDVYVEGNVVEVHADEQPPYVVIANRDGLVKVILYKDAAIPAGSIRVGDYLEAEGEKQNEQLFDAYDVSIKHLR